MCSTHFKTLSTFKHSLKPVSYAAAVTLFTLEFYVLVVSSIYHCKMIL